ncbi:hypothetical protein FH609_005035 [Streptomyces sp. 3MP-14]|uniref:PPM-type phosphatase domain-containing protein n=1 Tax=Streptomyces mimosae TaxID=2586635 RepID=A0A5N6AQP0_9ACTN|nr:hypothetical protein FH607_002715 [Streptomyces mimosae]KAB8178706.1 hypothetical protein FH609_005035 [Streptomyces sp. 3MP-14]
MPQLDQLSACPGCGEPLEEDDRFCGVCGTDLRTAARSPGAPPPNGAQERPPGYTPTEHDFHLPPPLQSPPHPSAQHPPAPHPSPPHPGGAERQPPPPAATPPAPTAPAPAHQGPPAAAAPPPPPAPTPAQAPAPAPPAPPRAAAPPTTPPAGSPTGAPPPAAAAPPTATTAPATTAPAAAAPDPRAHPPAAPPASSPPPGEQPPAGAPRTPAAQRTAPRGVDPRASAAPPPNPEPVRARCTGCGRAEAETEDGRCADCAAQRADARDHVERELSGVAAVSDLGLRHHRNEDAFSVAATALSDGTPAVVAVVCDGVSSSSRPHEASAAASEAAAESLLTALPRGVAGPQAMHDAVLAAAEAVNQLADAEQEPGRNAPACTIVSAVTTGGQLTVGWIGDSRAYWVPQDETGAAARLTEDDSWAAQMVAAGLLSEAEAMADHRAHAITAWLGADAQEVEPHTATFQPDRPGVVIICTDGLWNYAETAERMARLVPRESRQAPLPSARHLVRHALESGGHDNITVAVIPFPSPPAAN